MKKRMLSMLLVVVMVVGMALTASAAPDTDYTGYYKIGNAGQLCWFACLVVGDTSQSGITEAVPDAKAVLTADIDITVLAERFGKTWSGIGTEEIPFTGVFDGNGYSIKGLTIDSSLTTPTVSTIPVTTTKQGLFGVIGKGGIVRDVVLDGTASVADGMKLGAVCSENNGTIENVLSLMSVTGGENPNAFVHTNNGTVTNCYTNQSGTATGATLVSSEDLADGSITYALGSSFGQLIGTDTQPVHYNGENQVYQDGDGYTNELKGLYEVTLATVDGAQMRISEPQGLRFTSSIAKSGDFGKVTEYGTILIPTEDVTDISEFVIGATLNGREVAKVPAVNKYAEDDESVTFTAVIIDIQEKNYTRAYTARAYAILEDGTVVYGDTYTSRSIYQIAQAILADENASAEEKAVAKVIVDTVAAQGDNDLSEPWGPDVTE